MIEPERDGAAPVRESAEVIASAILTFHETFKAIARRSKAKFERRDWRGQQLDARERLDLYRIVLDRALEELSRTLGNRVQEPTVWEGIKAYYAGLITGRDDREIAETFFNSVTRRLFATVGVNPAIEFVDGAPAAGESMSGSIYRSYAPRENTVDLVREVLTDFQFDIGYADLERDSHLVADRVGAHLQALGGCSLVEVVEVISHAFFRNKGAYLVGRIRGGSGVIPFVLPLLHGAEGIEVDAVLLDADDISIVFSFTRSYFHVEAERPRDLVEFLKSIMPRKSIAELYTSIGYNKHGKTELYRDLLRHLERSDDRFEIAAGTKGMVMSVFNLPSFDVVFKVIRDVFDYPKTTHRQNVVDQYKLVFSHERAGRLVDTQEFEHLEFGRSRFDDSLLDELGRVAAKTVAVDDERVVIRHLYTERRLTPLNLYLASAPPGAAVAAAVDYGNAIKDLAAANIFPGDMLLKNFGVTRHGRVVFYDYDEVSLVTECNFRKMPAARHHDDELSAEPWFHVGERDMFPEEFMTFIGLAGPARDAFEAAHAGLCTAEWWQDVQARLEAGEIADIIPYRAETRLRPNPA